MPSAPEDPDSEAQQVAAATAFLGRHGIPAGARAFRLRQEFFRHGWDLRVREDGGVWSAHAVKPGRPDAAAQGTTEENAVRRALAEALGLDAATGPSARQG
jgi:hypothetical protein